MTDLHDDAADISRFLEELEYLPVERIDVAQPRLFQLGLAPSYFARLRREAPIHYCANGVFGQYWSITRHRDIETIELDPTTYSSDHLNGGITISSHPDQPQFYPSFIAMDPPRHTVQRRAVAPAFSPSRLADLASIVRVWWQDILDGLPIGEPFDWDDRVSSEITARTLALLLGFPQANARDLIRWSDAMVALPGSEAFPTLNHKLAVMHECFETFDDIWRECLNRTGGDSLISLLTGCGDTRDSARVEYHGNVLLLIVGGNETTRSSINGSVVAFDRFPGELEKLRTVPDLVGNLASEVIRWQTPAAHMRRTAMCDTVLDGNLIFKDDKLVLWYLSGNRDETLFTDGERFIIDRPNARRHLAFGTGIHRCIGARLAELQLRIMWEEILSRFPRIDVVGKPAGQYSTFVHGYAGLRVVIPEHRAG